ncbi:hypothetical protein C8R47DRAFT_1062981 [Mycena vitilis]|nr:hypothetical protein C8R47DRAFT_1080202 [Mycena vitilis]KAJ6517290.1 hypothetical protein C8R47DRAFT_1062981 [Mycena vitilis]
MKAQGMAQESVGVAALRGKLSPSKEKLARRWCGGGAVVARRMRRLNVSDAARAQSDAARHLEDAAPVVVDAAMSGGSICGKYKCSFRLPRYVQRYDGTATAVELNPDPWKIWTTGQARRDGANDLVAHVHIPDLGATTLSIQIPVEGTFYNCGTLFSGKKTYPKFSSGVHVAIPVIDRIVNFSSTTGPIVWSPMIIEQIERTH